MLIDDVIVGRCWLNFVCWHLKVYVPHIRLTCIKSVMVTYSKPWLLILKPPYTDTRVFV